MDEVKEGLQESSDQKEIPQPLLAGRIYRVEGLDKRQKEAVHFAGIVIELPLKQAELIGSYLTKEPSDKWNFWVYSEPWFRGFRGAVIAGPLDKETKKSLELLSDAQMARWFTQFLTPNLPGEIRRVEEIDLRGKPTFRVSEDRVVGFKEIWNAFKKDEMREKEGEKRKRGFDRAARRLGPMRGVRGEAFRRLKRKD